MLGLLTQFVVVASVSASSGLFTQQSLSYGITPGVYQEADMSAFSNYPSSYPVYDGWWADAVNTELVSNTGDGVYVAVLDTGLVSDWQSIFPYANIRTDLGVGFTHDVYYDASVDDIAFGPLRSDRGFITGLASGHGTHVTSTIVGFDIYGHYGIEGIAPDVSIIPVLVLDAWEVNVPGYGVVQLSGGTNEMIAAGIMYVANLADSLDGPVVINMSLGGPSPSSMIEAAINYAISKGVILVASAGNEGEDGMGYPGAFTQMISAAAAGWTGVWYNGWQADVPEDLKTTDFLGNNHQLYLSDFSSRPNQKLGQKNSDLDVAAPGEWIVGPYKIEFTDIFGYYYLSGTSMAAPHVTGMVALLLQSYPDLNQGQVEFILKNAAHGNPLPADGTYDLDPSGIIVFHDWNGGDYGSGFLTADAVMQAASVHT